MYTLCYAESLASSLYYVKHVCLFVKQRQSPGNSTNAIGNNTPICNRNHTVAKKNMAFTVSNDTYLRAETSHAVNKDPTACQALQTLRRPCHRVVRVKCPLDKTDVSKWLHAQRTENLSTLRYCGSSNVTSSDPETCGGTVVSVTAVCKDAATK